MCSISGRPRYLAIRIKSTQFKVFTKDTNGKFDAGALIYRKVTKANIKKKIYCRMLFKRLSYLGSLHETLSAEVLFNCLRNYTILEVYCRINKPLGLFTEASIIPGLI